MYGWEIKALGIHHQDQLEALTESAVRKIDRRFGIASNDPFDLSYLYNEPVAKIKPCRLMPTIPCDVPVPCDQCSVYLDYKEKKEFDGE